MTMAAFLIGYRGQGAVMASTMAFGTLCMSRLVHGFNCKDDKPVIFSKRFFNNKYLIGAFVLEMCIRDRPETICLQAVEPCFMWNLVLFVERSGELRWLARLSTKGVEPVSYTHLNYLQ